MSDIKEMLTRHEGKRYKPYEDTVGKMTIGIGRNLDDVGLSDSEIDLLFANDLAVTKAWVSVNLHCFMGLSPNRQNVLLDMAFNLRGRLLGFTNFLAALNAGDYEKAATEMLDSVWSKQVKERAIELAEMMRQG